MGKCFTEYQVLKSLKGNNPIYKEGKVRKIFLRMRIPLSVICFLSFGTLLMVGLDTALADIVSLKSLVSAISKPGNTPDSQLQQLSNQRPGKNGLLSPMRAAKADIGSGTSLGDLRNSVKTLISGVDRSDKERSKALISDAQHENIRALAVSAREAGGVYVKFNKANGTPSFIKGSAMSPRLSRNTNNLTLSRGVAEKFLTNNKNLLKLSDPASELTLKREQIDELGKKHFRYQQTFKGVPVWGKELMVHLNDDDSVYLAHGNHEPTLAGINTVPTITKEEAVRLTKAHMGINNDGIEPPQSELVVYPSEKGAMTLSYKVDIMPRLDQRWIYFIDAKSGEVLHRIFNIHHQVAAASGVDLNSQARSFNTWYESGIYYLIDPNTPTPDAVSYNPLSASIPSGDTFIVDAKNTDGSSFDLAKSATQSSGWDPSAVSAAYHTKLVYDYFKNTHGRNSIDDKGMTIVAFVHYKQNEDNAFWNGKMMLYGDGGQQFKPLAGALDVATHEMTHGVIQHTAGLIYENQSGALNESFADVFGAMVDRSNWLIGEDITKAAPYLRSLSDPASGSQPAKMSEYKNLPNTKDGNNGGVHINSGIPNRAAYLSAEGLTVEGLGTSIGRDKTEKIYYRALTKYLQASSQFLDARRALIQAAEDLYGTSSTEAKAVAAAWDAVEVFDGNVGSPDSQTPTPSTPVSGDDLMIYLYPKDGTHDKPNDPTELYDLYVQTIPAPFTGYDSTKDKGPLNIGVTAKYTRPAAYTGANGTVIFYVGTDYNLYAVNRDGTNHSKVTSTGDISSVAISPDGHYFAYTSKYVDDNQVYVIDLVGSNNRTVALVSQNSEGGEGMRSVLYADSLAFDYTGNTVVFDALNCLSTSTSLCSSGQGYRYWSVGFLKISDGSVTYPFPAQDPNYDIGYPSFASNNNFVVALDVLDKSQYSTNGTITSTVMTINRETQKAAIVAYPNAGSTNRGVWGVPAFFGSDDYVSMQALTDTNGYAFRVPIDGTWKGNPVAAVQLNNYAVAMPVMHRAGLRTLAATLNVSSALLDFGNVNLGEKSTLIVTINNSGNRDINITNISIPGTSIFSHNGTNSLLPQGKSMTIKVTFSPGQVAGTQTATLAITSDADISSSNISLTGTGQNTSSSGTGNAGTGGGGGGCFIATAAYGSYLDPHVEVLRKFRDTNLITNAPGRAFVKVYYQLSPPIADFIKEHEALKTATRFVLTPVVYGVKYPVGTLMFIGFATGLAVYRRKK